MFLGLSDSAWTALATVLMAASAIASVWVSSRLMRSQDRLTELQQRLIEVQKQANWLNGALESQSSLMLRLKAEELGKPLIWWDPTHEGPVSKRPPVRQVHGESANVSTVYQYIAPELRRYPETA